MDRRRFIQVCASAAACLPMNAWASGSVSIVRWEGTALGANCSLAIAGMGRPQAEALIATVIAEVRRIEALFSLYREDSELVRLNREGRLDTPSRDMVRLLSVCGEVHRLTGGCFDPTIQPVWLALADAKGQPRPEMLDAAFRRVGWNGVEFDTGEVRFTRPGMAMTLNGIAQGYATDRVADILRAEGCTDVLVNMGEIAALGEPKSGRPWRIGIAEREDLAADEQVELTDMAIATSSPQGTLLDAAGRVGHIVDPRQAKSANHWRRVSVMHKSATMADGLSTGFCLMDENAIEAVKSRAGIADICLSPSVTQT